MDKNGVLITLFFNLSFKIHHYERRFKTNIEKYIKTIKSEE